MVARHLDISYGDSDDCVYDLYLPDAESEQTTVAYIHGGFWQPDVDRHHAAGFVRALAESGFVVANIEYRRPIGARWPTIRTDVRAALAALAADARTAGQIVVVGHSAGGHIVSNLAQTSPPAVVGAVALAGCLDLDLVARSSRMGARAVSELIDGLDAEGLRDVDPQGALAEIPIVALHGTDDDVVPLEVTESYVANAGSRATLVRLPGVDHFSIIDPRSPAFDQIAATIRGF